MKKYELNSLALRKAGIYFKDSAELNFQFRTKVKLKEILGVLRIDGAGIADILEKLNGITGELNIYYKDTEIVDKKLKGLLKKQEKDNTRIFQGTEIYVK